MKPNTPRARAILGLALFIAFFGLLSGVFAVFYCSLPSDTGTAALPGLSSAVKVVRDEHGVPHIFANDMNDAVRALGYLHASERLFQMELQRRAGQGRLAEIFGANVLGVDKFIRTLGLYRLAQSSAMALSPEAQAFNQAYADGVNAWLSAHRKTLSPEFLLLGLKPEPWKPADSVVWGKLMALQLSKNYALEILRAELAKKLTPEQVQALFATPSDTPVTIEPTQKQNMGRLDRPQVNLDMSHPDMSKGPVDVVGTALSPNTAGQLAALTGIDHPASNEWVIAGSRTLSGKPILANDPHLGLEAPILWYLARIVTPGFSIKGATVPGLPIVLLGQNDHVAWGFTTTGSDTQDLFVETLDPQNPDNYLTAEGSKAFQTQTEVIHVKDAPDETLRVRSSYHGPVLSDIDPQMATLAGKGKVMALAFTGLGAYDTTPEALMHLNRASNWHEFLDALRLYHDPPQNVVYADGEGHIGFVNPGLVPIRKRGDGTMPVDGASGDFDWVQIIPFDELPQLYDPPSGFIFNANNAIVGSAYPYFMGVDWEEPWRAVRLQQYFDRPGKHTLDTSAMMQADIVSLAARDLLPFLLAQKPADARAREALDMLHGWDGKMDKDLAAPLIFEAWLFEMHKLLLEEKTGSMLEEKGPFNATALSYILSQGQKEWCTDPQCKDAILKALDAGLALLTQRDGADMQKWRWGDEHITRLHNKFYSHIPVLNYLSRLDIASSGDFYTLDRGGGKSEPEAPFIRTHGGGFRGIYDLGDPTQSRFMIATGESGHIFSRHYGDLVPLWNDVKSFTLTGTHDELTARGLPELILEPIRQ